MFPPFTGITSYRVRARLAPRFALSYIVMHLFALYLLFPPLLLPLDTETDAAATQYDYGVDDPSLLPKQPAKQTSLEHSDIAHFFPSDTCIRTATAFCMTLL